MLLDTVTYRISGHSPSDASSYRSKEEIETLAASRFHPRVPAASCWNNGVLPRTRSISARRASKRPCSRCSNWRSIWKPARGSAPDSELVGAVMFSNQRVEKFDDRPPEFLQDLTENPAGSADSRKDPHADRKGKPVPKMKAYNVRDAIFEAMLHRFSIDPTMVAFGEENRDWGGAFAVYRGLTEALPYHRLFNSPISEAGIVGAAVGYALEGGRVVAELMYADFMGRAGDEIFNQLSKWQAMSAGTLRDAGGAAHLGRREVRRTAFAGLDGACHHIPGLKVVYPVTPYDAKGMMNTALAGTDPVVFFESQKIYDFGEMFVEEGVPRATTRSTWRSPPSSARATTSRSSPSARRFTRRSRRPTNCGSASGWRRK